MTKNIFRLKQLLWFLLSFAVLAASCYFQWVEGLEPCPLCLMQRFCVFALVILCFTGIFMKGLRSQKILLGCQLFIGLAGVYFAGRQIWLQHLSVEELPSCLPGLDVLLQYFPWSDILQAFFFGAADCHEVTWEWLGLSMAAWSVIYFLFLVLSCLGTLSYLFIAEKPK